jgi:hypothetical protein
MADPGRLEAWNSTTLQDNISTLSVCFCMTHVQMVQVASQPARGTPFTSWLQQITLAQHIGLQ